MTKRLCRVSFRLFRKVVLPVPAFPVRKIFLSVCSTYLRAKLSCTLVFIHSASKKRQIPLAQNLPENICDLIERRQSRRTTSFFAATFSYLAFLEIAFLAASAIFTAFKPYFTISSSGFPLSPNLSFTPINSIGLGLLRTST